MRPYQKIFQKLEGIKNILDIGCGDGTLDVFLAKESGLRVVGLDISLAGFSHARKKALADGVEDLVACVKGNVCDMPFAKDSWFDAASLVYSLHHMEDPISALKEIRNVLKPGGKIFIVECIAEDDEGVACWTLNRPELIRALDKAGFLNWKSEMLAWEDGYGFALITAVK